MMFLSSRAFTFSRYSPVPRDSPSQPTVEYRTERRRSEGGYAAKGVDGR
jgi:hypothetical protein